MGGEASFDAQGLDQRVDALQEAYDYISERWQLWTKDATFGQPNTFITDDNLPADFQSYTGVSGKYNALPPRLNSDTVIPWGGRYPTAWLGISYYAAFRMFEDKGPEMLEKAMYWKQRFDQVAERLDAETKRRNRTALLDAQAVTPNSFGALRQLVSYNLDQSDMSEEDRRRKFPQNIIDAAINRAYMDISNKFELSINTLTGDISVSGLLALLPPDFVAPASAYATLNGIPVSKVAGMILPELTPSNAPAFTALVPSYRIITTGTVRWVQFAGLNPAVDYPATFMMYYDSKSAVLSDPAQKPWGGMYDDAFKLIAFKAMRDMMYGDAKTYNMSRFWQNEYDREEREFRRILKRLDAGSRVAVFGYSRVDMFGGTDGFTPINAGDSRD